MTPVDFTYLLHIQDLGLTPVLTRDRTAPAVVKYNKINSHTHTMSEASRCRTRGEANKFLSPSILAVRCSKSYSALQRNGSPAFSVKRSRLYFPVHVREHKNPLGGRQRHGHHYQDTILDSPQTTTIHLFSISYLYYQMCSIAERDVNFLISSARIRTPIPGTARIFTTRR